MWRSRTDGRPADSIKQFHRHLRVLNGTEPHGYSRSLTANPGSPVVTSPMSYRGPAGVRPSADLRRRRTMERRRKVLFSLAGAAALTLVFGLVGVKIFLAVHLAVDVLLVGYIALLARLRTMASEKEMKLHYLPSQPAAFEDDVAAWGEMTPAYAVQ